jgi:fluoride exporter
MLNYFWIGLGGALGSVARYWASGVAARWFGETFPWGTLIVNVSGSMLIGFFAAATGTEGRWIVSPASRQFIMLGVLGGYTTFSSFSLQTLNLAREGDYFRAGANTLLSVILCLGGVWIGHALAMHLGNWKGK